MSAPPSPPYPLQGPPQPISVPVGTSLLPGWTVMAATGPRPVLTGDDGLPTTEWAVAPYCTCRPPRNVGYVDRGDGKYVAACCLRPSRKVYEFDGAGDVPNDFEGRAFGPGETVTEIDPTDPADLQVPRTPHDFVRSEEGSGRVCMAEKCGQTPDAAIHVVSNALEAPARCPTCQDRGGDSSGPCWDCQGGALLDAALDAEEEVNALAAAEAAGHTEAVFVVEEPAEARCEPHGLLAGQCAACMGVEDPEIMSVALGTELPPEPALTWTVGCSCDSETLELMGCVCGGVGGSVAPPPPIMVSSALTSKNAGNDGSGSSVGGRASGGGGLFHAAPEPPTQAGVPVPNDRVLDDGPRHLGASSPDHGGGPPTGPIRPGGSVGAAETTLEVASPSEGGGSMADAGASPANGEASGGTNPGAAGVGSGPRRVFSNSELRTWKRCRRKWYLGYYRKLTLRREGVGPLSIGNMVHWPLEVYYGTPDRDPETFDWETPLAEHVEARLADPNLPDHLHDKMLGDYELVKIMLRGYFAWLVEEGADAELIILAPEREIEAFIDHIEGEAVWLIGKLDVEAELKSDGRRVFVDHKSVANLADIPKTGQLDEQQPTYGLLQRLEAAALAAEGKPHAETFARGGVWNMLRKVKRTATAKPPFYGRAGVSHNDEVYRNFYKRVWGEARDILTTTRNLNAGGDHQVEVYPNSTRDCAWDCPFVSICPMFDDGSDVEAVIEMEYVTHDPYARYTEIEKG